MGALAVGGPLGTTGSWGWDWWALVGAVTLFALLRSRRRLPLFAAIAIAAVGGLILSDLTRALGVVPVWGTLLLTALSYSAIRRKGPTQV